MKFIKKFIISIVLFLGLFFGAISVNAYTIDANLNNINTSQNHISNSKLDNFGNGEDEFFKVGIKGSKGIFYTLVKVAQSLKNLFFFLATIFYLIIAIKLIVAENTEEEIGKFKKGIIWITIGLMIMQIAYSFTITLYAKSIGESLAFDFINNIINPFIGFIEVFASFVFLMIAIFAFYRLVTANGKEEEISRAKMSILYAIMGFILLKLARTIVEGVYGKLECHSATIAGFDTPITRCITDSPEATGLVGNILQIINWANSFIALIVILLIIYAGFNVFISSGDEEKLKKAKNTIIYIVLGIFLLIINYLILTFFILPESNI